MENGGQILFCRLEKGATDRIIIIKSSSGGNRKMRSNEWLPLGLSLSLPLARYIRFGRIKEIKEGRGGQQERIPPLPLQFVRKSRRGSFLLRLRAAAGLSPISEYYPHHRPYRHIRTACVAHLCLCRVQLNALKAKESVYHPFPRCQHNRKWISIVIGAPCSPSSIYVHLFSIYIIPLGLLKRFYRLLEK